ncbi:hypothetical protein RRF57_013111 [Xylaria bambusicola]|uniref:Uncharacterized protein n=1 Tax=Xylaria bambusicola TaxID=326684 RepID=A0AAN7V699_9PEZI
MARMTAVGSLRETHHFNNKVVREGRSGPPLHIHWLQTEYFKVEKGVIGIHKNGKEIAATKDDGILEIPAGTRHRFWAHSSTTEDLVFKVWAEPQDIDHSFDENFLRNFTGYQRDCQMQGIKPSPFQLILLSYNSATMGTPPFWMPLWLLKGINYILAFWIAKALLGYRESYPEYTRPTKTTTQN